MTLKEKLRQGLTGHLSDEKTEVDVNIAAKIAEDFAIGFTEWCIKWRVKFVDDTIVGILYNYGGMYQTYTIQELLEIYKKEKGL